MGRAVTLVVFACSGCVPFGLPPAKVSVGAGPASGSVERPSGTLEVGTVTTLRAGLHPLGLVPPASRRAFDVGAGYGVDLLAGQAPAPDDRRVALHGPYLEGAYYPVRLPVGPDTTFRWGARGSADLLFVQAPDELGYGGSVATEIEFTGDTNGRFADLSDDGAAAGVSYGQWSLGAFVGGSVRDLPGGPYGSINFGLSARIPLVFGVVCCLWSAFSDHDSSSEPASPPPRHHRRARPHPTRPAPLPARSRRHVPAEPRPVDRD